MPLAGGQGASWRAGDVVLKPVDDAVEWAFVAEVLAGVDDGPAFRVARPVRSSGGRLVEGGWAATGWVAGAHERGRADDVLAVSAALHAELAGVEVAWPEALRRRTTPWAVGDRVAWGEEAIPAGLDLPRAAVALVERAAAAPPAPVAAGQVVHGDLEGNVVFADAAGLPPAVLDLSPYWRPAAFADAVVVADAVAWGGGDPSLAQRVDGSLLARAVAYRLVAAALLAAGDPTRIAAEVAAYGAVAVGPPP